MEMEALWLLVLLGSQKNCQAAEALACWLLHPGPRGGPGSLSCFPGSSGGREACSPSARTGLSPNQPGFPSNAAQPAPRIGTESAALKELRPLLAGRRRAGAALPVPRMDTAWRSVTLGWECGPGGSLEAEAGSTGDGRAQGLKWQAASQCGLCVCPRGAYHNGEVWALQSDGLFYQQLHALGLIAQSCHQQLLVVSQGVAVVAVGDPQGK
ncbi:hypothetical protein E2320_009367, partial [Naja naja]